MSEEYSWEPMGTTGYRRQADEYNQLVAFSVGFDCWLAWHYQVGSNKPSIPAFCTTLTQAINWCDRQLNKKKPRIYTYKELL